MLRTVVLSVVGVVLAGPTVAAQQSRMSCRDDDDGDWGERYCEIVERTIQPGGQIRVDAHPNGGVAVLGWDRNEISLRAKITAHARTEEAAESLGKQVRINGSGTNISAYGPESRRREWWSVSFELRVPKNSDLWVRTENGGIDVAEVRGSIDLETVNGGLDLRSLAGDVRAETTNGGVSVELNGKQWDGRGLTVRTTNGGVDLAVPPDYSASLETGTVNGGLDIDFPVRVQGRITKRITTQLGGGGPPIRVTTTNGGVTVRRS